MSGWGAALSSALDLAGMGQQKNNQIELNERAQELSNKEAQRNRDFQTQMSNTAHQRQTQDLKAAGLNPIMSVNSGASAPAGNMGSGGGGSAAGLSKTLDMEQAAANIDLTKENTAIANGQAKTAQLQGWKDEQKLNGYKYGKKILQEKTNSGASIKEFFRDDPNSGWFDKQRNKWNKQSKAIEQLKKRNSGNGKRMSININGKD